MKIYWLVLYLGISLSAHAQWKLVWADEFNVEGTPDPNNWKFERGYARNEEIQSSFRA